MEKEHFKINRQTHFIENYKKIVLFFLHAHIWLDLTFHLTFMQNLSCTNWTSYDNAYWVSNKRQEEMEEVEGLPDWLLLQSTHSHSPDFLTDCVIRDHHVDLDSFTLICRFWQV